MAAGHVFLERIVKVEGVVVGKSDFGDVAVNDLDIVPTGAFAALRGGRRRVGALLDPGEAAVGEGGCDEAELAGTAADIEDAGAGHGDEEFLPPRRRRGRGSTGGASFRIRAG